MRKPDHVGDNQQHNGQHQIGHNYSMSQAIQANLPVCITHILQLSNQSVRILKNNGTQNNRGNYTCKFITDAHDADALCGLFGRA
ncbi:hypothetical protein D3C86_1682750 [compost metagenome]